MSQDKNPQESSEKKDENLSLDLSKPKEEVSQETSAPVKSVVLAEELAERKKKAKIFFAINAIIFVVSLIFLISLYVFLARPEAELIDTSLDSPSSTNDGIANADTLAERKIDGVKVPEGTENNYLIAVMYDNHPDARPQSALVDAHLVFEAEVEGGMTRIMAVLSTGGQIEEIGPVRSARPYFIDWARELSALYVHVGGSPDALVKIQQDKIIAINEFFNGQYYWRDKQRSAPHNVYTSLENLEKFLSDKGADRNRFVPWYFKDDLAFEERAQSGHIKVDYKLGIDKLEWRYDRENNGYLRFVADELYREKSGESVLAKNVIIQVAEAEEVDEVLRLDMKNIGSGLSLICLDGLCLSGSWKKEHPSDRTRYYYEDGREVKFNRGMTWVQVVRPEIVYSWE